jgi:predicted O-methyltransferase YrrM
VTTTDIEPNKIAGTRENLQQANLSDVVTLFEGDAMQTLAPARGAIDFLFLDGAKELYLPVFELLHTRLAKGAIVFADNTDKAETQFFVNHILGRPDEFTAIHLFDNRALVAYKK